MTIQPAASAASVGAWSMLGTTAAASIMTQLGADWLVLDAQHGLYDDRSIVDALALLSARADPTPVLVRVPSTDEAWIGRALDAGATGVIVPMVNDAAQARRAADACRYAPDGTRSWGPMAAYWGAETVSSAQSNAAVHCAVMVETAEAVDNAREIATVHGVDMIFVGPYDLSIALGVSLDELLADRSADSALDRVVASCTRAGIIPGAFAGSIPVAAALASRGFRALAVAVDTALIAQAGRTLLDEARTLPGR